jgi:hypothetical protein
LEDSVGEIMNRREYRVCMAFTTFNNEWVAVLVPLRIGKLRVQRYESPFFTVSRTCTITGRVEAKAFSEACAISALNGLAQTLNWRENLMREIKLVI